MRKGKERFVCDSRLAQRLEAVREKKKNAEQMKALLSLRDYYDLDAVTGLSGFDRRQVCVPKVCEKSCSLRNICRYHQYLKEARSAEIFVQICNHNYLLADAAHRLQEMRPLLNDYRALVIDEAHKLPDAARQMYGQSLSAEDFRELCDLLAKEKYILASQRLREKFRALMGAMCRGELLEEAQRTAFILTPDREAALRDCLSLLRQLQKQLAPHLPRWLLYRLGTTEQALGLFFTGDRKYILYIQYDRDGSPSLCAASRELPEQLRRALWLKDVPAILTSGTLMAGGSFERTKKVMGLSLNQRLEDFIAVSPFNYEENCLLYIPNDLPKTQMGSEQEAKCLAEQICRLVEATHGHTLVLFTSLDYGDSRTGLATCDRTEFLTSPITPQITVKARDKVAARVCEVAKEIEAELIVIGLPLNMDGTEGERARKSRKLAKTVEIWSGLPVRMWDERQTTCAAADLLDESGTFGAKRKSILDSVSATVILDDYIQWRKEHPGEV